MDATLEATRRTRFGKNEAGRIRTEGNIPAVLYGGASHEAESITVDPKALSRILHSESGVNTLISLKLDGAEPSRVLVKDYLVDPVYHKLMHADFYRIAMDKLLRLTVPVQLKGESKGVKTEGGVLDFVNREIDIECLPADIPEHITIDITDLVLNQGVRVRDLAVEGNKWKAVSEPEMLILHIVTPKVEEAPAVDAAAAAATPAAPAEPEVIKKGKVEKADDEKTEKKK
jgi:large subunit ribosomal protein L25